MRTHTTTFRIELAGWRRAKKPSIKDKECPKFWMISHLKKKITKCNMYTAKQN